jgi:hypothetical protein
MTDRRQAGRARESVRVATHNVEPLTPGGAAATLLGFLGRKDARVRLIGDQWIACGKIRGTSIALGSFAVDAGQALVALGRAEVIARDGETLLVAGDGMAPAAASLRNDPPLEALARRREMDGEAYLDAAQLEAGRRFSGDFRTAGLTPGLSMNWSGVAVDGGGASRGLEPGERMTAARQRFHHALDAVGPDLAGPLVDLCVFEHGVEAIEKARRWPARSAKLVIRIGLSALARHYGLSARAEGPLRGRPAAWRAPGARPAIRAVV